MGLLLLLILALPAFSAANDDGEITEASIVLTVGSDFKVKEEVSITKRLLSYQALDTDGDPRTPYCSPLQTLTITRARVTTPGGKVIDSTPNALNLSTPSALVAHPALTGWQEMVVTFLGLEPGAQTELSYIREDKEAFRTTFEKKQILAWHFPIRKGTVTVRLPAGINLTYQIMNFKGEASANPVADLMEYTFVFKDIPAYSDREMHNGMAFLPALYLTTTPSWEAAGKNLATLAEKFGSPDEAITKKAKELTKDAITDLDKVIAIHKFVKERFKEVEWPLQDSLLLFNGAGKTFAAGQGTNLELALLLRAMLRATGMEASLMLTGPLPATNKAPGTMVFDHAVVWSTARKFIYLDPLKSIGPLLGDRVSFGEGWGDPPIISGHIDPGFDMSYSDLGASLEGNIEIRGENISGSVLIVLFGELNPYWKNLVEKETLEAGIKPFLPMAGLKIEDTQVKALALDETRLEVKFSGKLKDGERIIRLLPETKLFLPGVDPRILSSVFPVQLPDARIFIKWTIKGAGTVEPMELKPAQRAGEISIVRTPTEDGFILEAKLDLGMETLSPADYPGLQAALAQWQNPVVAGVLVP